MKKITVVITVLALTLGMAGCQSATRNCGGNTTLELEPNEVREKDSNDCSSLEQKQEESNPRHMVLETIALPTELYFQGYAFWSGRQTAG